MQVKIKQTHTSSKIPTYGTDGAACFDLYAIDDHEISPAGGSKAIPTGLCFEVPQGHVMMVYSRSGHGFKNGVRLANATGVIDSDYRGEVMVKLTNDGNSWFDIKSGDRIAQAMIIPVQQVEFDVVDELSDTERGTGGFGSTGV